MIFPISMNAIRFVRSAFSLSKVSKDGNREIRGEYPGLNDEPVPVKIIFPKKHVQRILILYPGASPFGEDHEEATSLAYIMSDLGFKVYMPRIPLLKQLIISIENIEWMICFYQWVQSQEPDLKNRITVVGMSFGGALLLKSCLDVRMQKPKPSSILLYSTFFDFDSSLNYLITGKYKKGNKEVFLKPNDWGGIVIMHNYLSRVKPGFDTTKIQQNVMYRIQNDLEKADRHLRTLSEFDRSFTQSLMTANYNSDVIRVFNLIRETFIDELEVLSPRLWCKQIEQKVFIIHGSNDSMIPYTESVQLSENIPRNMLFISHLYGHKTIERLGGIWFLINELYALIRFITHFLAHDENSNI
ncbi:MAG: hypothetical protein ACE5D7_02830 [Fidelibacterota bacterium]